MTVFLSAILLSSVFITSVISGVLGMVGGMLLMGVFAWVLPVRQAMILHGIAQFFANASRAFIHRRHIHGKSLSFFFAGLLLAAGVFVTLALVPDKQVLFFLLGIGPFLAFALPKNVKLDFIRPGHALLCGLAVGGFQLTGGVSGPMLDVFFQTGSLTRHQTVATKAFAQAVAHLSKFFYFSFIVAGEGGWLADLPLWICFAVVPAAMLGTRLSKPILDKFSDRQFYRVTQAVLLGLGVVYLVKAATY